VIVNVKSGNGLSSDFFKANDCSHLLEVSRIVVIVSSIESSI
jgi:hypothetical protein